MNVLAYSFRIKKLSCNQNLFTDLIMVAKFVFFTAPPSQLQGLCATDRENCWLILNIPNTVNELIGYH